MNIYVDFDDCLCETARFFSDLVKDMFDMDVPYEDIKNFNLQESFNLADEQYERMMIEAHTPKALLTFEETPGACETVNEWIDKGHKVFVITGRPYSAFEASRKWLDKHGLDRAVLYCLNKYGRDSFIKNSAFSLEVEDYLKMHFDLAIEDSPVAFRFFSHLPDLKVMVIDRPWNQGCEFPTGKYTRCFDWTTIRDYTVLK